MFRLADQQRVLASPAGSSLSPEAHSDLGDHGGPTRGSSFSCEVRTHLGLAAPARAGACWETEAPRARARFAKVMRSAPMQHRGRRQQARGLRGLWTVLPSAKFVTLPATPKQSSGRVTCSPVNPGPLWQQEVEVGVSGEVGEAIRMRSVCKASGWWDDSSESAVAAVVLSSRRRVGKPSRPIRGWSVRTARRARTDGLGCRSPR